MLTLPSPGADGDLASRGCWVTISPWRQEVVAKGTRLAFSCICPASTRFSLSFGVAWVGDGDMEILEDQRPLQPPQHCHWGIVSWSSLLCLNLSVAPQYCWVKFKFLPGEHKAPAHLIWYPSPSPLTCKLWLPVFLSFLKGALLFLASGPLLKLVAVPGMLFPVLLVTWLLGFLLLLATMSPPQGSLP